MADPRVDSVVGDGLSLDLEDDRFDTTLSIQVLEHTFEPYRMLAELRRVTRPGGTLIVMVPQTARARRELAVLAARPRRDGGRARGALAACTDDDSDLAARRPICGTGPTPRCWNRSRSRATTAC